MGNQDVPVFGRSINLVKFYMKIIWTETETTVAEDDTILIYMLTSLQSEQVL